MSRRLNFTHRHRVKLDEVAIQIVPGSKRMVVDVTVDLARLMKAGLPASYPVFLEAYHEPQSERIPLGTVATANGLRRLEVRAFGADEPVLFRLKVVDDDSAKGRLAAFCDRIRPRPPGEHETESLLDIKVGPVDGEVFRVELPASPADKPVLILNDALDADMIGGVKQFARSPIFISLVFPQAIRLVLTHWLSAGADDGDEESNLLPRAQWIAFAKHLAGSDPPDDPDAGTETDEWVDLVVASFAKRFSITGLFLKSTEQK